MYATQRPVERDTYEQAHFYSGKIVPMVMNLVLTTLTSMIVCVGATTVGNIHDKRLADAAPLIHFNQPILADLGFLGLQKCCPIFVCHTKNPKTGT